MYVTVCYERKTSCCQRMFLCRLKRCPLFLRWCGSFSSRNIFVCCLLMLVCHNIPFMFLNARWIRSYRNRGRWVSMAMMFFPPFTQLDVIAGFSSNIDNLYTQEQKTVGMPPPPPQKSIFSVKMICSCIPCLYLYIVQNHIQFITFFFICSRMFSKSQNFLSSCYNSYHWIIEEDKIHSRHYSFRQCCAASFGCVDNSAILWLTMKIKAR